MQQNDIVSLHFKCINTPREITDEVYMLSSVKCLYRLDNIKGKKTATIIRKGLLRNKSEEKLTGNWITKFIGKVVVN